MMSTLSLWNHIWAGLPLRVLSRPICKMRCQSASILTFFCRKNLHYLENKLFSIECVHSPTLVPLLSLRHRKALSIAFLSPTSYHKCVSCESSPSFTLAKNQPVGSRDLHFSTTSQDLSVQDAEGWRSLCSATSLRNLNLPGWVFRPALRPQRTSWGPIDVVVMVGSFIVVQSEKLEDIHFPSSSLHVRCDPWSELILDRKGNSEIASRMRSTFSHNL
jgi:hypothetical protein